MSELSDVIAARQARKWLADEYGWGESIEVDAKAVYDSITSLAAERDRLEESIEKMIDLDKYDTRCEEQAKIKEIKAALKTALPYVSGAAQVARQTVGIDPRGTPMEYDLERVRFAVTLADQLLTGEPK